MSAVATSPAGSLHRTSAATANRISSSPFVRLCRCHLSPCGESTAWWHLREELIPLDQVRGVRKRSRDRDLAIFSLRMRFGLSRVGFEFGRTSRRRYKGSPRAVAEAVGGDFGSFDRKWAKAVEVSGLKELMTEIVRNLEIRRRQRNQWVPRLAAAIVAMTLAGVFVCRSTVFSSRCAILGVAIFFLFGMLVDIETLRLISEKFQPRYAKASEQLQVLCSEISQVAHDIHEIVEFVLSSSSSVLVEICREGNIGDDISSGGGFFISDAEGGIIAPNRNEISISKNLVVDCKPDIETTVTNILQSVAHLMSIVAVTKVSVADVHSLSGVKQGIEDLFQEVQSVEAALLATQGLFHSKLNSDGVEVPVSGRISSVLRRHFGNSEGLAVSKLVENEDADQRGKESNRNYDHSISDEPELVQQTSNQALGVNFMPIEEALSTPPFLQDRISSPAHLERERETLTYSPLLSRPEFIPASASFGGDTAHAADRVKVPESIPAEGLDRVVGGPVSGLEKWSTLGHVDLQVGLLKLLPVINSVEEQSPLLLDSSENQHKKMILVPRIRSSSPDPWRKDPTAQPIHQRLVIGGNCEARPSHEWGNDDESQLVNLVLTADKILKTKTFLKDGTWNGKGVNANSTVDFWGKNAGSITKTTEQRGTLTKRNAMGRGGSFGSVDDLDNDRPQEQGKRISSEEDQKQLLRKDLSRSSRPGQPWAGKQEQGSSGRGGLRDGEQLWRDNDSAAAFADDYGQRETDILGPQILRRERNLDVRKDGPLLDKERPLDERVSQPKEGLDARVDLVYPDSVGGRFSPQKRPSNSTSNAVSSKSLAGEGSGTLQKIDETGFTITEGRGMNEGNYVGSNRKWDVPLTPDGKVYRGPEDGPQNLRNTLDHSSYSSSQSDVLERNLALQKYQQVQSVQFERYLDEAEALLEEGMQGLGGRIEVGVAERMLYEAAKLFESASDIDPANLTAVGQWGNTLLVHGELKLKVSQQIRCMLPSPKATFPLSRGGGAKADRERESMELTLQEVCEECEELLVDAGRKFRRALSLDRSDVRALYNWGLALCYRGQLIAEEAGERAMQDADKVYLAAIDKFEAMLGISQDYTTGGTAALLNWGIAMRDRSRLRAMGDKERVQLLLQARDLFQDAVRLDPNYGQARGAVAACSAELKELQGYEALQREDNIDKPTRNWWQGGG